MANTELIAGVDTYTIYGVETTYGTAATTINKSFGLVQSVTPNQNNTPIKTRGFAGTSSGGRDVVKILAGKYESNQSIEFQPLVWHWLEYVLGAASGSGTSGAPYVYVGANTVPSLTIATNINNVTTDREELYLGCQINTCTIKCAVGEAVSVSLDVMSADLDKDSTLTSNVALSSNSAFTFAGGSIELPNGSAIPNVIDSCEIGIANNIEVLYGLGSRVGKSGLGKARDYTVKLTLKYVDDTLYDFFLGTTSGVNTTVAEQATLALKFTAPNGSYYADFVFTGSMFDSVSENFTLNEMVSEDFTATCRTLSVTEVDQ